MTEQVQNRELPFCYTQIDTDYVCMYRFGGGMVLGGADLQAEWRNGWEKMI